ncbi:ammonium transporter Rh type A [Eurytemora carolleeae]|uniref:ammonium transporter Rh type A n=1 Tax=Eurytemora carolleeae TaxID=1294199 RepID=UPI000C77483A|nr:ammonium transporter Rh type A [Eurytemora carolleeae]|eukprot:XP_023344042.1 ammonium transporter Rh type A-like [Eurytemora affinis]
MLDCLIQFLKYWPYKRAFHVFAILVVEIVFIIIFGLYGRYPPELKSEKFNALFPIFADVHVMIYLGIGFILTFLRKYSLSAVTLCLLIGSISLQWYIISAGLLNYMSGVTTEFSVTVDTTNLLFGDFAAATVLISFCVVMGKVTVLQLLIMTLAEVLLYVGNEYIGRSLLFGFDVGATIFLHLFAIVFGLSVSRMLYIEDVDESKLSTSTESNLFSLLGTLILWIYWPSFMASGAIPGPPQERSMSNTYLALTGSVMGALCMSSLTHENGKIRIEHVQNAVLAGGVAVGATADLIVWPFLSILIGLVAGILSTCGFVFTPTFIHKKLKIHDSCAAFSLHAIPALLGSLVSIIIPCFLNQQNLGGNYPELLPAVAQGRSRAGQSIAQVAAVLTTIATATVGGLITGGVMRLIGSLQLDGNVLLPIADILDDEYNIHIEATDLPPIHIHNQRRPSRAFFSRASFSQFRNNFADMSNISESESLPPPPTQFNSETGEEITGLKDASTSPTCNRRPRRLSLNIGHLYSNGSECPTAYIKIDEEIAVGGLTNHGLEFDKTS